MRTLIFALLLCAACAAKKPVIATPQDSQFHRDAVVIDMRADTTEAM